LIFAVFERRLVYTTLGILHAVFLYNVCGFNKVSRR